MEIVSSNNVMRKFRTINEFQMDLGISKTNEVQKKDNKGPGQIVIKIKDPFIKRYSIEKGTYILKSGKIGSLSFYIDNNMSGDIFSIYDGNKEYKFTLKDTDNIREYLSNILDKVLNGEIEPIELKTNLEENIEFKLDKNLHRSEFTQKHKEMLNEMSKMDINPYKK